MTTENFKIVAFCCTYCAYNAADLAGSMRLQYPADVRIVKLLCTGKVEPVFLLEAFRNGADGVMVAGCMEGECHFVAGNLRAREMVEYAKELVGEAGIDPLRLEMFNMSASMAHKFVESVNAMVDRLKELQGGGTGESVQGGGVTAPQASIP